MHADPFASYIEPSSPAAYSPKALHHVGPNSGDAASSHASPVGEQAKYSRHDVQQTTPRAAPYSSTRNEQLATSFRGGEVAFSTPPRVRTYAPGLDTSHSGTTGLTPMAAQMQLGPMGAAYNKNSVPQSEVAGHGIQAAYGVATQPPWGDGGNTVYPPAPHRPPMGSQPADVRLSKHFVAPVNDSGVVTGSHVASYAAVVAQAAVEYPPSKLKAQAGAYKPGTGRADRSSWPIMPGVALVESSPIQQAAAYSQPEDRGPAAADADNNRAAQKEGQVQGAAASNIHALRIKTSQAAASPSHLQGALGVALRRGISPAMALRAYGRLMTQYEKGEVLQFQEVWFAGRPGVQKVQGSAQRVETNCGYDDARGDYLAVVGDHVAFRYEVLGTLGRGSFGQVLRCRDHATGATIALKIIRNKRRFQRQAQVEASILATLGGCDPGGTAGIVRMLDSFTFRSHLCITFELLSVNLYDHIKAGGFVGCSPALVRVIARQVLGTLCFLREMNIIHCDLKPENILLTCRGASTVKVIDFGSSCYADQRIYSYIQSRFYRAPEVILGLPYGPPIDIWSLACVLAELVTGVPLFPGEDEAEQLACITEVLGVPHAGLLRGATRARMFFDTGEVTLPCHCHRHRWQNHH